MAGAALVNDVVVGNEHNAPSLAVGTLALVQQVDEQQRVLVVMLGWIQRKESELRSDERRLRNYIDFIGEGKGNQTLNEMLLKS